MMMFVGESSRTLERVNVLLTPKAVDYALASDVTGITAHPDVLDRFFRGQIDSSFSATELTIVMRHGNRDPRFADGILPVYGDIRNLPQGELDYVAHRDINPATVVDMQVTNWDNFSLGFQLLRGEAEDKRRSATVGMNRRSLQLGTIAAIEVLAGVNSENTRGLFIGTGLGMFVLSVGLLGRRYDYVTKVRTCDVSAPMAKYYNNFTVSRTEQAEPQPAP